VFSLLEFDNVPFCYQLVNSQMKRAMKRERDGWTVGLKGVRSLF